MKWIEFLKKAGWKEGQPYTLQEVINFEKTACALQEKEEIEKNLFYKKLKNKS